MSPRRTGLLAVVPEAGPAEAETWELADYPKAFLLCRGYRHDWPAPEERRRWTRVLGPGGRPIEYRHGLTCRRCTLMVIEVIDARTGERRRKSPHYPDGYLRKGAGRLPLSAVHLEELRRLEAELGVEFEDVPQDQA